MPKAMEALVERISRNKRLDSIGQAVGGAVGKVLKPGPVKDFLSGTWLGHAAHPVLTDLPIGSFTSALALDLLGGEDAAAGAQTLVGLGILSAVPTALTGLSELADLGEERDWAVGAAHAFGNTAALACYGLSYLARRRGNRAMGIFWTVAGSAAMSWSAYLGGHLRSAGASASITPPSSNPSVTGPTCWRTPSCTKGRRSRSRPTATRCSSTVLPGRSAPCPTPAATPAAPCTKAISTAWASPARGIRAAST